MRRLVLFVLGLVLEVAAGVVSIVLGVAILVAAMNTMPGVHLELVDVLRSIWPG